MLGTMMRDLNKVVEITPYELCFMLGIKVVTLAFWNRISGNWSGSGTSNPSPSNSNCLPLISLSWHLWKLVPAPTFEVSSRGLLADRY